MQSDDNYKLSLKLFPSKFKINFTKMQIQRNQLRERSAQKTLLLFHVQSFLISEDLHHIQFEHFPEELQGDEHEHGLSAAAEVVRDKATPKGQSSLVSHDEGEGLQSRAIHLHPGGRIRSLESHSVLGSFQGSGHHCEYQTRRHACIQYVGRVLVIVMNPS